MARVFRRSIASATSAVGEYPPNACCSMRFAIRQPSFVRTSSSTEAADPEQRQRAVGLRASHRVVEVDLARRPIAVDRHVEVADGVLAHREVRRTCASHAGPPVRTRDASRARAVDVRVRARSRCRGEPSPCCRWPYGSGSGDPGSRDGRSAVRSSRGRRSCALAYRGWARGATSDPRKTLKNAIRTCRQGDQLRKMVTRTAARSIGTRDYGAILAEPVGFGFALERPTTLDG